MQIVIDVDENVFTRLFDNGTEDYDYEIMDDDLFAIAKSIRNGIPLPKGHGRLGDLDKLEKEIDGGVKAGLMIEGYENYSNINDVDDCLECVKYADAIIEADRSEKE